MTTKKDAPADQDSPKAGEQLPDSVAKSYRDAVADPATFETPVTVTEDDGTTHKDVQKDVPAGENPDMPNTDRPKGTPGGPGDPSLNYSPVNEDDEAEAKAREGTAAADNPDMPDTDRPEGAPGGPADPSQNYSPSEPTD